jgi:hypothetical protein
VLLSLSLVGCAKGRFGPPADAKSKPGPHTLKTLSSVEREQLLERARVWQAIDTASLNLVRGPDLPASLRIPPAIGCNFHFPDKPLTGLTPKFQCELKPGDVAKVKYGVSNGEVYAEVAASRLLWALGFKADVMVPSRVTCLGCPADPFKESTADWHLGRTSDVSTRVYDVAVIERPFGGRAIEMPSYEGWAWPELDKLGKAGAATRAELDAFTLLAVFIQHSDSKPEQQKIACLDSEKQKDAKGNETCASPWLVISDLGGTFGKATRLNTSKMNLADWDSMPIWRDAAKCVGDLPRSFTGSLDNPHISEAGRRFLADRLTRLRDKQIRDLFVVSNVEKHGETTTGADGTKRKVTVDDWARVFKRKRSEIVAAHCPS